jgi:hypothetical protein
MIFFATMLLPPVLASITPEQNCGSFGGQGGVGGVGREGGNRSGTSCGDVGNGGTGGSGGTVLGSSSDAQPDLVAVVAQPVKVEALQAWLAVRVERAEMRQSTVAFQTEDTDFGN